MRQAIYRWSARRLQKLYGPFDPILQFPAYRCTTCGRILVLPMVKHGRSCLCGGLGVRASNFSLWEELRLLFCPWSFRGIPIVDPPAVTKLEHFLDARDAALEAEQHG